MRRWFRTPRILVAGKGILVVTTIVFTAALLAWSQHSSSLSALVAGAALATLALVLISGDPGPGPDRVVDTECAFCGASRADVRFLVAGPRVAICDRCCTLSQAIFSSEFQKKGDDASWKLELAKSLPDQCPHESSTPLLDALARGTVTAPQIRALLNEAVRLDDGDAMALLLARVPEADRIEDDGITLGVAHSLQERFEDSLRVTEALLSSKTALIRALALNNIVAVRLLQSPTVPQVSLEQWRKDVDESKGLIATHPTSLAAVLGTEAELCLRLGDVDGCARALAESEKLTPLNPARRLTRARMHVAKGRESEARTDLQQAARDAHPQTRTARDTRAALELLPKR